MKLLYMGTGAAEGVPSMFCRCDNCKRARLLGGRNIRSRSQALLNDELLIDFPADTYWHFTKYNFDCEKICGCLITHSHRDHLYPGEVEMAKPSLSHEHRIWDFYATQSGYDNLMTIIPHTKGNARAHLIAPGERFEIKGEHTYSVLPMHANHDPASCPVIYSIECEGKRMLYAHDSGYFGEETWQLLKGEGHFDLVSIDCTHNNLLNRENDIRHMSFSMVMDVLNRMREQGNVDDKTVLIANHFSHNGGECYDTMRLITEPKGVITSYDGMIVEF